MQEKRRWLPRWQRVELVDKCLVEGMSRREAAEWRRVSVSTVQYWVARYRSACPAERASGVWAEDRPCTPHRQPARCSERVHDRVCAARKRTGWGPRLIASELGMAHATVWRCLRRRGLSRAPRIPRETVRRFEWPCPGDLLQMDVKRFARFNRPGHRLTGDRHVTGAEKRSHVGYEFAHSIIDDHSRLAYTELHPDEQAPTVTAFLARALEFYERHGIIPSRLQTDNHSPTRRTAACVSCSSATASITASSRSGHPSATGRSRDTSRHSPESGATGSATAQATQERQRYQSG